MATRICIVGGGTGGTMLANRLAAKLHSEIAQNKVKLTVLSNSPWHYFKPGLLYVPFGRYFKEDLRRSERSLLRPEVDFHVDEVSEFDYKANRIHTRSGQHHEYDYLVIATGLLSAPEQIEGLKEAGDHFYDYGPALRLAKKLKTIEKGRIFATVSFPEKCEIAHECGIAPVESILMLDEFLRQRGVRNQIELVYSYPTLAMFQEHALFLQKATSEVLPSIFESRDIHYQRDFTLGRVDPDEKVAYSAEGGAENFDILLATPPPRPVDAVVHSLPAGASTEGWLPTNAKTLKVRGLENVYVIGDTTDLPISKAGGTVHAEAPVVVNNIVSEIRLGHPTAEYDGRVTAIGQMGLNAGMPLWYDYDSEVQPMPPTKLGGLMRRAFNRGYWSVARGIM